MKVCETIQQSLQHVKTSLGTAADKTSATVKKASQIALKILKVLFTPITYLCTRAKSFFDKRREKPSESPKASDQGGIICEEELGQAVGSAQSGSSAILSREAKAAVAILVNQVVAEVSAQVGSPASLHPAILSSEAAAVKIRKLGRGHIAPKLQNAGIAKAEAHRKGSSPTYYSKRVIINRPE